MVDMRVSLSNKALPKLNTKEKHNIKNDATMLPILLPESADLETEAVGVFHWHIQNWKTLETKCRSPSFEAGGFEWRILLFPAGNNQKRSLSVYLEVAHPEKYEKGWHVCGQFALVVSNPQDPTNYYSNTANHRFTEEEVDWGFTRFYDISDLTKGTFLVQNETVISAFVRVIRDETGVLWHNFINYDSRKETGYVGIKNQGATCYMNSLLQSLYFTNALCKAVYQIPTENDTDPAKSIALALQRCFYNLHYAADPIGTTELTKSFGWDSLEAFKQHDVQEFNRVLQDSLEEKMKGTPADGAISRLFEGKMKSFIKCINVDFESSRVENYYDIQLNVKGLKTLADSFDDYITVETLEGDNKYHAEEHGLQDAHKGVIFETFPPVLHLQLKRFEYDFMRETMVKINDRHEFPAEINLDKYCSNSDKDGPYDYELHGVLVHSGDISGGHYFALIRPEKADKWYRFDDDRVIPATKREVFEENYGDDDTSGNDTSLYMNGNNNRMSNALMLRKYTNAYMLVYIRKSKLDEILAPIKETDIPEHLKRRLDEERALLEKRKQDRQDMHLYNKIAIITDKSFTDYQGFDLAVFDDRFMEVSPAVDVLKALKSTKVSAFKQAIAEHYKLSAEQFRLWSILYRQNRTVRVDHVLIASDDRQTMEKLREGSSISAQSTSFVKLYLEKEDKGESLPVISPDQIILFIKYFDIDTQKLKGLGHIFVSVSDKVSSILSDLVEKAELPKNTSLQLFEEVKPTSIDTLKAEQSFKKAELQNGDIISFQRVLSKQETDELTKQGRFTSVVDYYASIYHRVCIMFKPKPTNNNNNNNKYRDEIKLILNRTWTYSTVASKIAERLNVEASKIQLTSAYNNMSTSPRGVSILSPGGLKPSMRLEEMLPMLPKATDYAQFVGFEHISAPVLFYEVLEVDVADLKTKRTMDVVLIGSNLRKETKINCIMPRTATVYQLLEQVITKGKANVKEPFKMRLFDVKESRIIKEFSLDDTVDSIANEKSTITYAEPIPSEELESTDQPRLIQVVHYHTIPSECHSIPFKFMLIPREPFEETKKRLQKRTGLGDMDWKKVKITLLRNSNTVIEEDSAIDFNKVQSGDVLGLDHVDKNSRSRFSIGFDKGIFIRG